MKYAIGITTFNRYPKKNYLKTTLRSMERGGVFNYKETIPVVVSDSGGTKGVLHIRDYTNEYNDIWPKITFLESDHFIVANENRAKVLHYCLDLGATYIMFMSDDVIVRPAFMEAVDTFIEKYPLEKAWVFYASYMEVLKQAKKGIDKWDYPFEKYYGSICHVTRRDDTKEYADALMLEAQRGHAIGGDIYFAHHFRDKYGKGHFAASCPCYTQHIGHESVLSESHGKRQNQSFDVFFRRNVDDV